MQCAPNVLIFSIYRKPAKRMAHLPRKLLFLCCILTLSFLISFISLPMLRNMSPAHSPTLPEKYYGTKQVPFLGRWSHENDEGIKDEGKFHVVTNVILVTLRNYSVHMLYGSRVATMKQLEDRQLEIDTSLQINLNNDKIAVMHVLYYYPEVATYITRLRLNNSQKLVLHLTQRDPTVDINLDYIQKYLKNKTVILLHQDNVLGEGWEKVNFTMMRSTRLMYPLTRHYGTVNDSCDAVRAGSCNPGHKYIGSHDAFVFDSSHKFEKAMLNELKFIPSSNGMENVFIWYVRDKLGFKVLNPCLVLKIYHMHCIPIREKGRKRYNTGGKSGTTGFTKDLS